MDNNVKRDLFFKVWKNVIIRKEILYHLRFYNKHFNHTIYNNSTSSYKYKSYINKLKVSEIIEPLPYGISEIIFHNFEFSKFNEKAIPTSVHTITFLRELNGMILDNLGNIPESVKTIKFGEMINQPLKVGTFSENITSIEFGEMYNRPIKAGVLPDSITSLEFGDSFNQSLRGYWLPSDYESNLKSLKFGKDFNQPVEDINECLPKTITSLVLPRRYLGQSIDFNWTISKLSANTLEYYYDTDSNVLLNSNSIPNSVTNLTFDNDFNEIIQPNIIPNSVTFITFGNRFNKPIQSYSMPIHLSSITFGDYFNQTLDFSHLMNLQTIKLGSCLNVSIFDNFKFPPNLTSLTFPNYFNEPIPSGYFLNLPLKSLTFGKIFNQYIDNQTLPSTLSSLDLNESGNFINFSSLNQLVSLKFGLTNSNPKENKILPNSLREISFIYPEDSIIKKEDIPMGVLSLSFDRYFNQSIGKSILPDTITTISFNHRFDQIIGKDVLPNSLTSLTFGISFKQIIEVGTLPNSITFLSFGSCYRFNFPIGSLPTSLKELEIHSQEFNQDLSSYHFTSSFQTIYINQNSKLANILNSNFFYKFVKYLK
ncbi:hypothetical protein ACTA71_011152 [Dictyostelium dimigraforme]